MAGRNYEGLRVLDFSRVLAGPYLTQMMRDLGAEVIKIERPGRGADERLLEPIHDGQSGYYMMLNRGKKSVTLNLKDPQAKKIIFDLVKISDIVVENFAPGVMHDFGLNYEELRKQKEDIIMCSISTFGQEGPYSRRVGYDIVAQAMSGLMWMTGFADRAPLRSGTSIGDVNCSAHALGAIGAALYYREKTGKGQHIDMALRDCLSAILETAIVRYTMTNGKDQPMRSGNHHATMAPYGVYDAGNENYVILGALNPELWSKLCTAIGRPDMIDDPKYRTSSDRAKNLEELKSVLQGWLKSFPDVNEALAILEKNAVPSAPVLSIHQLVNDPQLLMRDMLVEIEDPIFGKVKVPATPMRFSETSVINAEAPPLLGANTEEVLEKLLGITQSEFAKLKADKVV